MVRRAAVAIVVAVAFAAIGFTLDSMVFGQTGETTDRCTAGGETNQFPDLGCTIVPDSGCFGSSTPPNVFACSGLITTLVREGKCNPGTYNPNIRCQLYQNTISQVVYALRC